MWMLSLVWSAICWLGRWMLRYIGPLLILAGLLILTAAAYFSYGNEMLSAKRLIELSFFIASALLASGAFAWLTKVTQLTGAIREELEATIFSERHLRQRRDIDHLWTNATRSLHKDSFRGIESKIYQAIKNNYLPTQTDFYLSNAKRIIWISVVDRDQQIVAIKTRSEAMLIPDNSRAHIVRKYKFSGQPIPAQFGDVELSTTAKSPIDKSVEKEAAKINLGNRSYETSIRLRTDRPTLIVDQAKWQQALSNDNVLIWRARSYVDTLHAEVHYDATQLVLDFWPIGNIQFHQEIDTNAGHMIIETDDLVFSQLGYIIGIRFVGQQGVMA